MNEPEPPSLLEDVLKALIHVKTLFIIIVFTLLVSIHSNNGFIKIADIQALAITILSISGTMVALILPAAELAYSFVSGVANTAFLTRIIDDQNTDPQTKYIKVTKMTGELRDNLLPAWRASIYALTSFILAVVGILLPNWMVALPGGLTLAVEELVVIGSLAFLVGAAIWFLPSARYAFRLHMLDRVDRAMKAIADLDSESRKPTDTQGA